MPLSRSAKKILLLIFAFTLCLRLPAFFWGLPSTTGTLATYHPDEQINFYSMERWQPRKLRFPPGDALYWGSFHLYLLGGTMGIATLTGYVSRQARSYYKEDLSRADRLYRVARLLSVFFGLLAVGLAWRVGRRLFGETEGIIAALLAAWVPVQVVATTYAKVDCMILFWGLLIISASALLLTSVTKKQIVLVGLACGLAAATKYTAGIFVLLPLLALFFHPERPLKWIPLLGAASLVGFAMGCPALIFDFPSVADMLKRQFVGSSFTESSHGYAPWAIEYLRYYLPYSLGVPLTLWCVASVVFLAAWGSRLERWLLVSFAFTYIVITTPQRQFLMYVLPLLPYGLLISARGFTLLFQRIPAEGKKLCLGAFAFSVLWSLVYTVSYTRLFWEKDTRQQASEWITENIKPGTSIGIAKSFSWTPPVLRRYESPYIVDEIARGEPPYDEKASRLRILKAPYLVLAEPDTRDVVRSPEIAPAYAQALSEATEKRYAKVAEFENHTPAWIHFGLHRENPWDWIYVNPTISIYKLQEQG